MTPTQRIDMSGFGELAKNQTLPTLRFSTDSDLYRLSSVLMERVTAKFPQYTADKDEVTQEEFTEAVVEILDDLQDEPDLTPIQVETQQLANALYFEVQNCFHLLRHDISKVVDQLVHAIYEERNAQLKANGMEFLCNDTDEPEDPLKVVDTELPEGDGKQTPPHETEDPSTTNTPSPEGDGQQTPPRETEDTNSYEELNWDQMFASAGTFDMLVTEIQAFSGLTGMSTPTRMGEQYLVQKMSSQAYDIEIDDADFEDAVKQTSRIVGNNEHIKTALRIALKADAYLAFYQEFVRVYQRATPIEQCRYAENLLLFYHPIFKAMKRLSLPSLTDEKLDLLNSNLESIRRICLSMAYQAWFHRKVTFAQAIMLSEKTLNPDMKEEFFNNGGTYTQLKNYIRANHIVRKLAFPSTGISAKFVKDQSDMVSSFLEKHDKELLQTKNALRMEATTKAFHVVMEGYVKANADKCPAHLDASSRGYLAHQMAESISGKLHGTDDNLEHAVYTFLLQMFYPNSMVAEIFDMYNKEVVSAMENHSALSSVDATRIDASVALSLMSKKLLAANK